VRRRRRTRLFFCRLTQLGLLRLLSAAAVMGPDQAKSQQEAWKAYERWLEDERIELLDEPGGLETHFRALTRSRQASPKDWADSYLAAFAVASRLTVVTFDQAFEDKANCGSSLAHQPRRVLAGFGIAHETPQSRLSALGRNRRAFRAHPGLHCLFGRNTWSRRAALPHSFLVSDSSRRCVRAEPLTQRRTEAIPPSIINLTYRRWIEMAMRAALACVAVSRRRAGQDRVPTPPEPWARFASFPRGW
jgi:predicted nucleic acid-binding protein